MVTTRTWHCAHGPHAVHMVITGTWTHRTATVHQRPRGKRYSTVQHLTQYLVKRAWPLPQCTGYTGHLCKCPHTWQAGQNLLQQAAEPAAHQRRLRLTRPRPPRAASLSALAATRVAPHLPLDVRLPTGDAWWASYTPQCVARRACAKHRSSSRQRRRRHSRRRATAVTSHDSAGELASLRCCSSAQCDASAESSHASLPGSSSTRYRSTRGDGAASSCSTSVTVL